MNTSSQFLAKIRSLTKSIHSPELIIRLIEKECDTFETLIQTEKSNMFPQSIQLRNSMIAQIDHTNQS